MIRFIKTEQGGVLMAETCIGTADMNTWLEEYGFNAADVIKVELIPRGGFIVAAVHTLSYDSKRNARMKKNADGVQMLDADVTEVTPTWLPNPGRRDTE